MSREIEIERGEIAGIIAQNFRPCGEQYDASDFEWAALQLQNEGYHKESKNTIELLERQLSFWKGHCTALMKALEKEEEISNRYSQLLDKTEEELNAERVKSEWISVDERLPKQWNMVLVFGDDTVSTDFIASSGRWYEHIDHDSITHWMPLPEAPKMKGGAE